MTAQDRTANTKLHLRIRDGQVVSEAGEVYDLHEAVEGIPWVTAVQYPPPHQYVIFDRCPSVPWEVVICVIHKHPDSYLGYFRGYRFPMRYFEFEGRRYWRSSSRGPGKKVTHMLNRCLLTDVEPPRRVDQG